jgi:hypothetical protein
LPASETQHLTAEEARVLAAIREARKMRRAEVLFTIRRGRVVQCEMKRIEEWDKQDADN